MRAEDGAMSRSIKDRLGLNDDYWNRLTPQQRRLYEIVRPAAEAAYAVDVSVAHLENFLGEQDRDLRSMGGSLEMEPDFQRGHVWTPEQQSRFMENVLRQRAPMRLMFNCPNYSGGARDAHADLPRSVMQCIDGLQRATTLLAWQRGRVEVFGGMTFRDFENSPFDSRRITARFEVYQFTRRAELLQFYLDLNSGGTVHSANELARVAALRDQALAAARAEEPDRDSGRGERMR